jgi:hypothetical protein
MDYACYVIGIGMAQSGSEPKLEPELFRTGPKFDPRFDGCAEPDHKSSSGFRLRLQPFGLCLLDEGQVYINSSLNGITIYIPFNKQYIHS